MSNLTEESHLALVKSAQTGDREAYWTLVEESSPLVYRTLLRLTRDQQTAEDILSQTFVKAHDKIGEFRADSKISTWFVSIALNLARNIKRSEDTRKEISWEEITPADSHDSEVGGAQLARWGDPEKLFEEKQLRELMDKALEQLPEKYRQVFVLRDSEGLSTRETALALNISETAVKSRAVQARFALRKYLAPYFESEEPELGKAAIQEKR